MQPLIYICHNPKKVGEDPTTFSGTAPPYLPSSLRGVQHQEAQGSGQGPGQECEDSLKQLINDLVPSFVHAMRERILQLSLGECRSIFAPLYR